jgi:hypothetical protein
MSSSEKWVSKFQIKPNSWVFVPNKENIQYGNSLKLSIEKHWSAPNFYYHLNNGGHVKALKSHTEHYFFIHLDIKDFFGSINRSRITRCLKEYFEHSIAREMAIASTVRLPNSPVKKYILPFGFVQSPIIALICLYKCRLHRYLQNLSTVENIAVSIYVDDIVISGDDVEFLAKTLADIKITAKKSGFTLNSAKEEGPAEKITAFNIELSHGSLRTIDTRFDAFCDVYKSSTSANQLEGIIGYVSSVNTSQSDDLQKL